MEEVEELKKSNPIQERWKIKKFMIVASPVPKSQVYECLFAMLKTLFGSLGIVLLYIKDRKALSSLTSSSNQGLCEHTWVQTRKGQKANWVVSSKYVQGILSEHRD